MIGIRLIQADFLCVWCVDKELGTMINTSDPIIYYVSIGHLSDHFLTVVLEVGSLLSVSGRVAPRHDQRNTS